MLKQSPFKFICAYGRKFLVARSGNVVITFAVALAPLMAAVGGAVDYSNANSTKAALRGALDSAALSLVKSAASAENSALVASATSFVAANINRADAQSIQVAAQYDSSNAQLNLSASTAVRTSFMGIFGISSLTVNAVSKAKIGGSKTWPVCVLITDPDQGHTLLVKNKATIDFNNCMVQVNTQNWDAVEARDTSYIRSVNGVNCFTGDIHYGDVTPPKEPTCTLLPDPYASYDVPTNACTYTNTVVNSSATLGPGTYCGGLKLSGGTITLSPGLYFMQAGDFQVLNSTNVIGNGVTILLSGSSTNVNINTTGTITMSPNRDSSAGQWAGFLFYWDQPSAKKGQKNVFSGATMNLSGVLYFKGQTLSITNGANVTVNTGSIIAEFLLPDAASLKLTGTTGSPSAAEKAMTKALSNSSPILVQ